MSLSCSCFTGSRPQDIQSAISIHLTPCLEESNAGQDADTYRGTLNSECRYYAGGHHSSARAAADFVLAYEGSNAGRPRDVLRRLQCAGDRPGAAGSGAAVEIEFDANRLHEISRLPWPIDRGIVFRLACRTDRTGARTGVGNRAIRTDESRLSFAWSYESLLTFRAIQGLGLGGEVPIAAVYINEIIKAKGRGRIVP